MSDAFGDGIVAILPRLRRFAIGLSGTADRGDDLVQAACERALARRHQFREGTRLDSWMYRIIQTAWIDSRRENQRNKTGSIENIPAYRLATDESERHTEARSLLAAVSNMVDSFSPEHKTVFLLVVIEGYSYIEAANIIGVPRGTVMSRLARAREILNNRLGGDRSSRRRPQRDTTPTVPALIQVMENVVQKNRETLGA